MDIVIRTLIHLTVTTKVIGFNFDGFMKNLPLPADLKAMIMDMNQKQQELSALVTEMTSMDYRTGTPFIARKPNEMIKPTSMVTRKAVTKIIKPVTRMNKAVTKMYKPVTQSTRLLRSLPTLKPGPCILKTTPKSPGQTTTSQSPLLMMPMPMPMPMGMQFYSRVPIVLPMKTYYERVEHDHPPLYKIKEIIEEDKKKWEEEKIESDNDISVVIKDSDISTDDSEWTATDTDTSAGSNDSEYYSDLGPDYYDDLININVRGRDR